MRVAYIDVAITLFNYSGVPIYFKRIGTVRV